MHELLVEEPDEDIFLLLYAFASLQFEWGCRVPAYSRWYRGADHTEGYRYFRKVLQTLQWLRGGTRWVLKAPQHLEQLEPLLEVFPDATLVQTHRDPVPAVLSLSSLTSHGARRYFAHPNPHAIGADIASIVERLLTKAVEDRPEGDPRFVDIRFRRLPGRPHGCGSRDLRRRRRRPHPRRGGPHDRLDRRQPPRQARRTHLCGGRFRPGPRRPGAALRLLPRPLRRRPGGPAAAGKARIMSAPRFDPFAPEVVADPGPAYSALRARCPFARHDGPDQTFWILSDYREIREEILQDNPLWAFRWGNAQKDGISDVGFKTDPPFHIGFRNAIARGFTPKRLAPYRDVAERIVDELITAMEAEPSGEGDFHDLFAFPLPARMMCVMLGAPEADYRDYKRWADALQHLIFVDPEPGSFEPLARELYAHFGGLVAKREALLAEAGIEDPTEEHLGPVLPDDFMSRALVTRVEGRRLTHEERMNVCLAFLTGGQETTIGLLTNLIWRLLETPALWEQVKADPSLIESAVEESLRLDPPVLAHFRTSTQPVEMHGEALPERAKLMFSIAGGNRDPDVFPDPDTFRLDRPLSTGRQHLSFGSGLHFCIGAPVARLEAQIALRRLTERLPDLRLLGEGERIDSWMHWGRARLPVAWGPA